MFTSTRNTLALVAGLILLVMLACAPAVLAGTPASVTVRVEGLTETKVPPTQVTTTTEPVVKDGKPADSCPGTSAAGALQLATAGSWSGTWYGGEVKGGTFEGLGYSVEEIEGESHLFNMASNANYYWSFWLNDKLEEEHGVCDVEMETGDQVLLFPECAGTECPPNPTPLAVEVPPTANAGEAVNVTVKQYNSKGEASPAEGASVGGGGTGATTDSQGHATLKLFGDGTYTLRASGAATGPPVVRTETTICVHEGNDGTCGTTSPKSTPVQTPGSSLPPKPEAAQPALVADAGGVRNGHIYSRNHAPRVLSGKVVSTVAVTSISIRLRRSYKGRCWAYNGARERLERVRCGGGSFFKVSSGGSSFSYLLPSKLPPGRYVCDVEASNTAGEHTALHRGSSSVVFYVK
jgi:hypothetical protein